jgi:hypothetical protein
MINAEAAHSIRGGLGILRGARLMCPQASRTHPSERLRTASLWGSSAGALVRAGGAPSSGRPRIHQRTRAR